MIVTNVIRHSIRTISIILVVIICSNGLNILGWSFFFPLMYYAIMNLILIFCYLVFLRKYNNSLYFSKYASYLIIWPIIVILFTNFVGGSSYNELRKCFPIIAVFFFIYKRYDFNEKNIISAFTIIGLLTTLIQIYEQLHPEFAIFGVVDPDSDNYYGDIAGKRNDLYRLWVGSYSVQVFCFNYYINKFFEKRNLFNIIFCLIFAVSIYLYLTRQLLVIAALCVIMSLLLSKTNKSKITSYLLFIVMSIGVVYYWDLLFSDFIESYHENTYTTDIRWEFMSFLFDQYITNPIAALIGHGHLPIEQYWADKYSYYLGDVGFVGDGSFYYGIIWCVVYFYVVFVFYTKLRNIIPTYLVCFVLATFCDSIFCFPFFDRTSMLVWISVLYISSVYIKNRSMEGQFINEI